MKSKLIIVPLITFFLFISCLNEVPNTNNPDKTNIIQNDTNKSDMKQDYSKSMDIENDSIFPIDLLLKENPTDITFKNTHFSKIPKAANRLTNVQFIRFINQKTFPEGIHNFPNVKDIGFLFSTATELPSDINLCKKLNSIGINETRVKEIPSLCNLKNLEYLLITNSFVKKLPNDIDCLRLKDIVLIENKFDSIPETFFNISTLESVTIDTLITNISKMKLKKSFPNTDIYYNE